jgi:hypothetical protein
MVWDYQFRLENVYDQGKSPREHRETKKKKKQTKEEARDRPREIMLSKARTDTAIRCRKRIIAQANTTRQAERHECGQRENPDSDTECTPAPHQKAGRGAQR